MAAMVSESRKRVRVVAQIVRVACSGWAVVLVLLLPGIKRASLYTAHAIATVLLPGASHGHTSHSGSYGIVIHVQI